MKAKFLLISGLVLAVGTPALAQTPPPYYQQQPQPGWDHDAFWRGAPENPWKREEFLRQKIYRNRDEGRLDRGEAQRAIYELDRIDRETHEMTARTGGRLDPDAAAHLNQQLDQLSSQIRWQSGNPNAYGAQPQPGWDHDAFWRGAPENPWQREEFLRQKIYHSRDEGRLGRDDAQRAIFELDRIDHETRAVAARDGGQLDPGAAANLNQQLDQLSRQIQWEGGRR